MPITATIPDAVPVETAHRRPPGSEPAIKVSGLVKTYGDVRAVDGVDFEVKPGTVLGLLGPNGAGKTTAVRVLTTLLKPDAGEIVVDGVDAIADPARPARAHRPGRPVRLGRREPDRQGEPGHGRPPVRDEAQGRDGARQELLEQFDLSDASDRMVKKYSGGMRRRLDLAAALVAKPPVLFLDEPTTGPRPAQPAGPVGHDRAAGGRRHHGAADHPVPGRGRPAGRRHRRDRPRQGHRPGHARPS